MCRKGGYTGVLNFSVLVLKKDLQYICSKMLRFHKADVGVHGCFHILYILFIGSPHFIIKTMKGPNQLRRFTEIDSLSSTSFFIPPLRYKWCVLFHRWSTRGRSRTIQLPDVWLYKLR